MSYFYNSSYLELEIYRLLTILEASPGLAYYAGAEEDTLLDYERIERLRRWEIPEVSRIVISIAAIIRGGMNADPERYAGDGLPEEGVQRLVGTLNPDIDRPEAGYLPLNFREALNKVIHAKRVEPEWDDDMWLDETSEEQDATTGGDTPAFKGHLYLYGDYRKKNWLATVNLRQYAMAATAVVPMEGVK
jgi:hypothetical protein